MLGIMTKQQRVFNKAAIKKGRVLGHNQDGDREWITIIATIWADSTIVLPAIIFAGKSDDLQTTWVEDVEIGQHQASFASLPNS